jgi:hypothetical protein
MRSILRIAGLILLLLALLLPFTSYANGGPCPDDLVASQNCAQDSPPYYVVVNRDFERLGPEYGTGCQPWILDNPDCEDCTGLTDECLAAAVDVEQIICGYEMPNAGATDGDVLYEMCCDCATDVTGAWVWRTRTLQQNPDTGDSWECPVEEAGPWNAGLPPRTGIDLPAPLIVGGLGTIGVALLLVGVVLRRRLRLPPMTHS